MPQITRKAAGCQGKDCPAIFETSDPQVLAVQGLLPEHALGAVAPEGEGILLVPASLLREWASGQR